MLSSPRPGHFGSFDLLRVVRQTRVDFFRCEVGHSLRPEQSPNPAVQYEIERGEGQGPVWLIQSRLEQIFRLQADWSKRVNFLCLQIQWAPINTNMAKISSHRVRPLKSGRRIIQNFRRMHSKTKTYRSSKSLQKLSIRCMPQTSCLLPTNLLRSLFIEHWSATDSKSSTPEVVCLPPLFHLLLFHLLADFVWE